MKYQLTKKDVSEIADVLAVKISDDLQLSFGTIAQVLRDRDYHRPRSQVRDLIAQLKQDKKHADLVGLIACELAWEYKELSDKVRDLRAAFSYFMETD